MTAVGDLAPTIENLGYFFGSIVTLIIGYWRFGRKDKKEIEELRQENSELRKAKYICENKRQNLKDAFELAYKEYSEKLDRKEMGMLESIRDIIND